MGKQKRKRETDLYNINKSAKVGEECICPICGVRFKKKQYSQAFHHTSCKDRYWNKRGDRHSIEYLTKMERLATLKEMNKLKYPFLDDDDMSDHDWDEAFGVAEYNY